MTSPASLLVAALFAALSSAALAMPAHAEGPRLEFFVDRGGNPNADAEDDECQTVTQAIRSLKRQSYSGLSYIAQYSDGPIYFFSGHKRGSKGQLIPFHLKYDSCEREIVFSEAQY